ncbi:UbiA family prenyltransferase [Gammaproteobacteria bacterium]|nr:UbiA family prenyltransferase [Gammaproteobacteria bacterium]
MLFVDLDKTLIKSDFLLESFVSYFSQNIFAPILCLGVLLRKGKVGLKKFLSNKSYVSIENLPYNQQVLDVIYKWKEDYPEEKVFLISATHQEVIERIAIYLKCFDGWYGTENENLKSEIKLKKIKDLTEGGSFTYIGDSFADVIIWENAKKCYLVNPSRSLLKAAKKINNSIEIIASKKSNAVLEIIKTIRIHQWVKNLLIFIPTILSLKPFIDLLGDLVYGFFAFSFIASAFYILNDLFDIENDRVHHSKKNRPLASGALSITQGFFIFIFFIAAAVLISISLPQAFQLLLLLYAVATFTYSKYLKKFIIIDILTLSSLYLLRVITGGALADTAISNWLLTFSVFFFLFLASVKRWVELNRLNVEEVTGRGYQISDKSFISNLSYFSGLISVLVICLYIESQQALSLYSQSKILWFIPFILLYWILETLFKAERGQIDDDPVKYALKSKTSYLSLVAFVIIFLFSAIV